VFALAVLWANLVPRVVPPSDPGLSMLLAAIGCVTVAIMPMLLESSISAAQRDRPALASGALWLATHSLVVLFAIIVWNLHKPGRRGDREGLSQEKCLDRIKWICVVSIGAGFAASVSSLLLSSRFASAIPACGRCCVECRLLWR
jgi:fructose-specific phosphotransferase system IIC component